MPPIFQLASTTFLVRPLEAGTITMSGPIGNVHFGKTAAWNLPRLRFRPSTHNRRTGPDHQWHSAHRGQLHVHRNRRNGYRRIPPFTVPFPTPFVWTNRPTVPATISRSQPLTITWSNGYAGALVYINGQSQVSPRRGRQLLHAGPTPAQALSPCRPRCCRRCLRRTRSRGNAQGSLDVYQVFSGTEFSAPGMDEGTTQFADGFDIGSDHLPIAARG